MSLFPCLVNLPDLETETASVESDDSTEAAELLEEEKFKKLLDFLAIVDGWV